MEGIIEILTDKNIQNLLEKALKLRRPMSSFLDANIFDPGIVLLVANKVVEKLIRRGFEMGHELEVLHGALKQGEVDAKGAVKAILEEDALWFKNLGDKFGVKPSLVLFIFDTPLRPFFEEIVRRVEKEIIENWWEPFCPVCGRLSQVARMRNRKRYITCTYCGAQYLVDLFLCPNCGNNDPTTQGFVSFENFPEYELSYCEKCKHYIKVIKEDEMKSEIPQGLEDLLTRELDEFAKEHELGLIRC